MATFEDKLDAGKVLVMPVTYQTEKEILKAVKQLDMPFKTIVADTLLGKLFPHSGIPYQIWIKNGRVLTIPWSTYATFENISKAIRGEQLDFLEDPQDRMVDPMKPLFTKDNGFANPYFKKPDAVVARRAKNYRVVYPTLVQTADSVFLYAVNNRVENILYGAFKNKLFPLLDLKTAIKWELDSATEQWLLKAPRLSMDANAVADKHFAEWLDKNTYGYSLRHAKMDTTKAYKYMQDDLIKFFGLYLGLDIQLVEEPGQYLVLRCTGEKSETEAALRSHSTVMSAPIDKVYWHSFYRPYHELFPGLINLNTYGVAPEMVDSTGLDPNMRIDFEMPKAVKGDLNALNQSLAKYHLRLTEETLPVSKLLVRSSSLNAPGHGKK